MRLTRRTFLAAGALLPFTGRPLFAAIPADVPQHGLSSFGDLKYRPGFTHFDYANTDAPEGGTFSFSPPNWQFNQNVQTFNTLNTFVPGGDAPPRMELCFDTLMVRALDEPDALYGLIAESVTISSDRNAYEFRLRPEARFHDGTPLTARDAAFSLVLFKDKGHPSLSLPLARLVKAEATDLHVLTLTFDGKQSERAILTIAEFPVVSETYYSAHPFDSSSLDIPLGSGPYRVGAVNAGSSIVYEKVADYWGRDLPVNRGINHFAQIRIDFFRERQAGFEAFKKGDVLFRQEFTSKVWATEYDFPAITSGKVVKRTFPSELRPSLQAWAFNLRRKQFQDVRVRQAIGLCFDFEWTRTNFFYGSYERSHSLFENSAYRAEGMPSAAELALLEPLRGQIPDDAFGDAVMQPASDGSGRDRALLKKASTLLAEAGYRRDGSLVKNAQGEPLRLEMLVNDEVFVRIDTPFIENLKAIGIDASITLVDPAQYQARQSTFDFDMVSSASSFTASPARDELAGLFHSSSAALNGSRNLPGTSDPATDRLIAIAAAASTRADLTIALKALDRVLRARRDWIPNWHAANHRTAYWDMFGFAEPKPDYGFPVETLWWLDKQKADAIGKG